MNKEQAASTLETYLLRTGGLDATPVESGVGEYARAVVERFPDGTFHVDVVEHRGERSVYLLSKSGLDLFTVGPEGDLGWAEITRETLPPAKGLTVQEKVTVYPAGRGRRLAAQIHYPGLDSPLVLKATAEAEAAVSEVMELVRVMARTVFA